jgi:tRNA(fMet)-specific endonuclease VapC
VTRYLLDSGIANEYVNRRPKVFARARAEAAAGNRIGICTPVLGELLYGLEFSATRAANLRKLRIALGAWAVWPFDIRAAEEFGRLRAELRRAGRPMQIIDVQLAAVALTLSSCTVVTADSDLLAVPGLTVENWAA